ncbi:alpha-L-fucosidase [Saccharicrinis sp. 156]|uniref:alpha-L-fucosidase n=1 Tax=Saccharicrinis sp. 156 TaxID=3417574 RepID=UPI003D3416DD
MKEKYYLSIFFCLVLLNSAICQSNHNTGMSASDLDERMKWWEDGRFGMFIHWGVYSVFGGEWDGIDHGKEMGGASSEWIYLMADIPQKDYKEAAHQFNPIHYNAAEWVRMAKNAGMKYIVLTSKHHDGFAMFDTKASDWNIMKSSVYEKDIVKAFIEECHKNGIRVGLYYSHEKDWYHRSKVGRDTSEIPQSYEALVATHLKELLTNYGQIDLIWFDMGIDQHKKLNQMCFDMVRKYQPECIISSRIGNNLGDYRNLGDRELAPPGIDGYVESIMTLRLNWGFDKNDSNWKSSEEVIAMLSKCACRNSNFLLNIGPGPDGRFTPEEIIRLENIGQWTKQNGEAIYETKGSPFKAEYEWGSVTTKENKAFLHLYGRKNRLIQVNGIQSKVKNAYLLDTNIALSFMQNTDKATMTVTIPESAYEKCVPIVALELEGELKVDTEQGPTWLPPVVKHTNRRKMKGILVEVGGRSFTLNDGKVQKVFTLNEHVEYRMNDNGIIQMASGFHLIEGNKYTVIYTPGELLSVEIITRIE